MKFKKKEIIRQLKLLLIFFAVNVVISIPDEPQSYIEYYLINTSILYFIYNSNHFFFKRYFKSITNFRYNYLSLILTFIIAFFVATILYFIIIFCYLSIQQRFTIPEFVRIINKNYIAFIFGVVIFSMFHIVIELIKLYKNKAVKAEKAISEKLRFQYDSLRNQINPHFMFNNLNILHTLINDKNTKAKEFVENFSGIYRYILSKRNTDFISLNSEIEFIEQYLDLLKLRYAERLQYSIEIEKDLNIIIVPMALQLLVENVIKHNSATVNIPLKLKIYNNDYFLIVRNNLQKKTLIEKSEKFGLKNLSSRYKYLVNKDIVIEKTQNEFVVKLPIIYNKDESTGI